MTFHRSRASSLAALVTAGLLALAGLTACSGANGGVPAPTAGALAPEDSIAVALDDKPTQYNPTSAQAGSPADAALLSGVLGAFWRYRPDGTVERTTDFGTYRKVADDPLTVKYTINSRAVWSDGVPVECDDVALAWLANSGATGVNGFTALDVARFADMNRPKCRAGDKDVVITYRTPVAQWETAFGPGAGWLLPAHVVERQARLRHTFVDYLDNPTSPDLVAAAAFWNTGWATGTGPVHTELMPSSGPYVIDSWQPGGAVTLKANPRWWGKPPVTGTVVVRFLDPQAQVAALASGQVQAISATPDAAVVAALRALGPRVRVTAGARYDVEHLDFNLRGGFADHSLREAFARCVPRRQIVDSLVKPLDPGATILESRFLLPFQPAYAGFTAAGRPYDTVDLAGSRRLLAGRHLTVRVAWRKDPDQPDPRRQAVVGLLTTSCAQAGITVVDAGTPTFLDKELPRGLYDVALFSWTGSPEPTASSDIFASGGASNLTGYADPAVDRTLARLVREPDRARQEDLLRRIDARLWADLVTLPLFAHPALVATVPGVSGIGLNPADTSLTWNVAEWHRA